MLSGRRVFVLLTLARSYCAAIKFTMGKWEIEEGKGLVLTWTDANGLISIDLVRETIGGLTQASEIVKDYAYSNSFTWTPAVDLIPGYYAFHIRDEWGADESPKLAFSTLSIRSSQTSHDNVSRDTGGDDGIGPSTAAGIGVGSTLGGILLLSLVAFLVYRGRQNKARLGDQDAGEHTAGKQKQKEPQLDIRYESLKRGLLNTC